MVGIGSMYKTPDSNAMIQKLNKQEKDIETGSERANKRNMHTRAHSRTSSAEERMREREIKYIHQLKSAFSML